MHSAQTIATVIKNASISILKYPNDSFDEGETDEKLQIADTRNIEISVAMFIESVIIANELDNNPPDNSTPIIKIDKPLQQYIKTRFSDLEKDLERINKLVSKSIFIIKGSIKY